MKVFKFGGASIKNPEAVKQLTTIVAEHQAQPLVIVVSAMGKTTQALETIFQQKVTNQPYHKTIEQVYLFHQHIVDNLLSTTCQQAHQVLVQWKDQLIQTLQVTYPPDALDRLYSSLVVGGEIMASKIIGHYLQEQAIPCTWLDAREYIKTNSGFRNAQVDWDSTQSLVKRDFIPLLAQKNWILTQGFIGSDEAGETTTLGKESSDFTGAILAATLGAQSLTIWKDVPGIMNADPKLFQDAVKFGWLSYQEMAKMAFYGAQVVHPHTLQPLAMEDIPLYVKPFNDRHEHGTVVLNRHTQVVHPTYILRADQCLVRLTLCDFTFLDEQQLSMVFEQLAKLAMQINVLERTAYSLSLCLNNDFIKLRALSDVLQSRFKVHCNTPVSLLTVMYPADELPMSLLQGKTILLEQQCQELYQVVFKAMQVHPSQEFTYS